MFCRTNAIETQIVDALRFDFWMFWHRLLLRIRLSKCFFFFLSWPRISILMFGGKVCPCSWKTVFTLLKMFSAWFLGFVSLPKHSLTSWSLRFFGFLSDKVCRPLRWAFLVGPLVSQLQFHSYLQSQRQFLNFYYLWAALSSATLRMPFITSFVSLTVVFPAKPRLIKPVPMVCLVDLPLCLIRSFH